jgi:hypothetical protein
MTGIGLANNQYFTPKHLPNLKVWLDATDVNANSTNPADNTAISAWVDKSGNGNSGAQATGANQPFFRTSGINSKPAIQFTGSPVFMGVKDSATIGIQNSPFEMYFIAKTSNAGASFLISCADGYWEIDYNPGTPNNGLGFLNPFASIAVGVGTASQYTDGNAHILGARSQSGAGNPSYARADSVDGTPTNGGLQNQNKAVYIGMRHNSSFYFNGYIGEIIIVNTQLTTNQRTVLENYLKNKWGTP